MGQKSQNSAQKIVQIVSIKDEQLKELPTTESKTIDELLVPVTGDPYLLNKLVEDLSDENSSPIIHQAKLFLEIRQMVKASLPQMIEVAVVKCNHGTTFTEKEAAWTTIQGIVAEAMSGPHAVKVVSSRMISLPFMGYNNAGDMEVMRTSRIIINIRKWLKMIQENHGAGAFYPNSEDDQYRIVIIRHGCETAGTLMYVSGYFRIECSITDSKAMDSI